MMLQLHATSKEVMRAVEALQEFGRQKQLSERDVFGLALALEECASNIVNHAFRRDPKQQFSVTIEHTGSTVTVELRDAGPEFDPTKQSTTRAVDSADDQPPGGWGIQLVRQYTDNIWYQRQNGENVLRLTKRLKPSPRSE